MTTLSRSRRKRAPRRTTPGGDHRAGDRADLRGHEHRADLGRADRLLALLGRQHAGHRRLDLVDRVVDDVVVADVDAVVLGQLARAGIGAHVEADDHGLRGDREVDVALADAADRRVHDLHLDLVGRELEQRLRQRFLRALHVGLDDQRQHLLGALPHLVHHVLEVRGLALGQLHVAVLALTEGRDLARPALVAEHHELVAGLRHFGQALDLDRNRRAGLGDRLAVLVEHGAHPAEARARQHDVAALQRAALHQHGRDRAAALVELRFDDQALGHACPSAPSAPAPRPAAAPARAGCRCPARSWPRRRRTANRRRSLRARPARPPAPTSGARCWPRACRSCSSPRRSARLAAFAWAIASLVCGITPSSAATTRMTMSVALAPRARIAVNAAWPGVSRKVIMPRGVST